VPNALVFRLGARVRPDLRARGTLSAARVVYRPPTGQGSAGNSSIGLLADLKARGLLDSTLVVWGGEFGRMPVSEQGSGRDHNPEGFLIWMAGGGIKGGYSYGNTDEIGYKAVENPVSVHDIHATILHLLGVDHKRLTYLYNGRRFRLTDVAGNVIHNIIT
jgi:hypothetical protein